jgi:hypothetical protein
MGDRADPGTVGNADASGLLNPEDRVASHYRGRERVCLAWV